MIKIDREAGRPLLKGVAVLVMLLLPLLLTGCDVGEAEADFFVDLAVDWGIEKKLITVKNCPPPYTADECSFGINAREIARWKASRNRVLGKGMDLFGVQRVDPQVGAALDAAEVVYNAEKADALAAQGMAENDLEKIDEAIAMRPGDWSYQDRRAAVLLAQGDADSAGDAFAQADSLVADRIQTGGDCKVLQLNKLRNREQVLYEQSQRYPEDEKIRNALGIAQSQVWALENNHESSPCK